MNILAVLGIALVSVTLVTVLKQYRSEFAIPVEICAVAVIILLLISPFTEILHSFGELMEISGIDRGYFKILLKSIGVILVVQLAADTCRDNGSSALANKVELAGRISVILLVMPMIASVAEFAIGLIKG